MLRLALKSVKHNPKRLILTAVAVALGVALIAATHIFTNALSSGFSKLFGEIYATIDVVIEQDPDGDISLPDGVGLFSDADLQAVRGVNGVSAAEGALGTDQGQATLLTPSGDVPTGAGGPSLVFNWTGNEDFDRAVIVDGRAPAAPGEIVMDVDGAAKGYTIGGPVVLVGEDGRTEFTLVGTAKFGENNDTQTATLMWATVDDVRQLIGLDSGWQSMGATVDEGADAEKVAADIQKVLPQGTRALTGEQKAAEQVEELDSALQYVDIFTLAFALVSLFVGAYIIVNTFRIIVTQRTREFGLLRAIGMTGSQLRTMILLEAIIVGILASTLGIAIGWVIAFAVTAVLEIFSGDIFGALTIPPDALAWSYGMGITVTLVSALMPAIHASTISPMEALRESGTGSRKPLRLRNIVGAGLTAAGIAAIAIGLNAGLAKPYIWVGVGAVGLVLGVTLLAAQVLVPIAFALRGVLTSAFGVDGKIAANNIRREPRRSANTAAALMIGVMLLALVATFTESFKSVLTEQFQKSDADFFVIPQGPALPQGAIDIVAADSDTDFVTSLGIDGVTWEGSTYSVAVIQADTAQQAFAYRTDPEFSDMGAGVFVDPTIQDLDVKVGDAVTLKGSSGTLTLPVTGLYLGEGDANFWVDWDTGHELLGDFDVVQSYVVMKSGTDVDAAQQRIEDALSTDYPLVMVAQPGDLTKLINQVVDIFLGVISALLGSALVIAMLGVANTLLLSVTERTREIGLLRAVGLRRRSVWRMITLESVVMATFGAILGMIVGVSLGAALVVALKDFGFTIVTVPWLYMGGATIAAIIAGVIAAIWPAWRASRLDILQAIAADG